MEELGRRPLPGKGIPLFLALFACSLIPDRGYAQTEGAQQSSSAVSLNVRPGDESVVVLKDGSSQVTLAAWDVRTKETTKVVLLAIRRKGAEKRLLARLELSDCYEPKLITEPELRYRRERVVLLQTQFGAAAARIHVLGIGGSRVHRRGSIDADYFDFTTLGDGIYLVGHDDVNLFDVPRLYGWTGSSFADVSTKHPEFYKSLSERIRRQADTATFTPQVRSRYAEVLRLASPVADPRE